MSTAEGVPRQPDTGAVSAPQRLTAAAAQVGLIGALVWLWSTGSSDATATTVDWPFVLLATATPLTLALSAWTGRRLDRRFRSTGGVMMHVAAVVPQRITLGLLALALLIAPFAIFGAVVFGPMG
jgi:hypothetical protein